MNEQQEKTVATVELTVNETEMGWLDWHVDGFGWDVRATIDMTPPEAAELEERVVNLLAVLGERKADGAEARENYRVGLEILAVVREALACAKTELAASGETPAVRGSGSA